MSKKILFVFCAFLLAVLFPFFALQLYVDTYVSYHTFNQAIVFVGILAHIDFSAWLLWKYWKESKK